MILTTPGMVATRFIFSGLLGRCTNVSFHSIKVQLLWNELSEIVEGFKEVLLRVAVDLLPEDGGEVGSGVQLPSGPEEGPGSPGEGHAVPAQPGAVGSGGFVNFHGCFHVWVWLDVRLNGGGDGTLKDGLNPDHYKNVAVTIPDAEHGLGWSSQVVKFCYGNDQKRVLTCLGNASQSEGTSGMGEPEFSSSKTDWIMARA